MKFKTLVEVLQSRAAGNNGITFVNEKEDIFLSYKDLYNKASIALKGLQTFGLSKGSELILQVDDNEKYLIVFWAALLGGIIPVPVSPGNSSDIRNKLFKVATSLKKPYIIADNKNIDLIKKYAKENMLEKHFDLVDYRTISLEYILGYKNGYGKLENINGNDIAFVQFTSGTTSFSKGVVLTHSNLIANAEAIIEGTKGNSESSSLSWMPLFHDMGLIGFHLTPVVANTNHFFMPTSLFIRRPLIWMKKASQYKIKVLACPNFGYKYFLSYFKKENEYDWDLSDIKVIFNGAEYISTDICNEFLEAMRPFGLHSNVMFPVYGMAEGSLAVTFPPKGEGLVNVYFDRNYLSIGDTIKVTDKSYERAIPFVDEGYPVMGCEVKICDENGNNLEENRIGIINIRGTSVTKRYYNNEQDTAMNINLDGFINTGDIGVIRNGRLIFIGRHKDIVLANGNTYHPHDIETIAEQVEGIELGRIAVCGVPEVDNRGHNVVAFIYYKKKMEQFVKMADALKALLMDKFGFDIEEVIPIREMPKTTSGKIQRYKLIDKYIKGEFKQTISELVNIRKNIDCI